MEPAPMPPLSFSDDDLVHLMYIAEAVPQENRGEFLQAIAAALGHHCEIGPGLVYREAAKLQRYFADPPPSGDLGSKYR
jgi:hypothetical protein